MSVTEAYRAQLGIIRLYLDRLAATPIDDPDHDYCSFQFDSAATHLAFLHRAIAEDWELGRYLIESTKHSDVQARRWARLAATQ